MGSVDVSQLQVFKLSDRGFQITYIVKLFYLDSTLLIHSTLRTINQWS